MGAHGADAAGAAYRCEERIKADGLYFCVDCGTSFIKTLLFDASGFVVRKYGYDDFPYVNVGRLVSLNDAKLILTGARADALRSPDLPPVSARYPEIDCVAQIAPCLGFERAVIACVGTGTPFIVYENGEGRHIGGTGVGGGTFQGLSARLLGVADPIEVERMAAGGDVAKVNITIGDLYPEGSGFLQSDYTAANFAKPIGGRPRDIAMGIHSLVSETVGMMAAFIAQSRGIRHVVICGGVCENQIICSTVSRCLGLFGLEPAFVANPCFGTCFGAISKFTEGER